MSTFRTPFALYLIARPKLQLEEFVGAVFVGETRLERQVDRSAQVGGLRFGAIVDLHLVLVYVVISPQEEKR